MGSIVCRYGEIALKGRNRGIFEAKLVENMNKALSREGLFADIKKIRGRIFVYADDVEKTTACLQKVIGLVSVSPAVGCSSDPETIKKAAFDLVKDKDFDTFRVTTRRSSKDFPMTSNEMDIDLGALIADDLQKKVSLKGFDLNVEIEIHDSAFIFTERFDCPGGIPVGMSGKVLCYIEKETDLLAAWLMMKRGCRIYLAGKERPDFGWLKSYYPDIDFILIDIIDDLDEVAEKNGCMAVIFGDSIEELEKDQKKISSDLLKLHPLLIYDKRQASEKLKKLKD